MNQWPRMALSEICEINPKRNGVERLRGDADVSFVPMAAVDEVSGTIVRQEVRKVDAVTKGYTPFRNGDVLFAKITPCMENGKAAVARDLLNGIGFGSTEFFVLRPKPIVLAAWIFAFLRQPAFRSLAKANFTGTAGQQRVPADFLKQVEILVPPIEEQERIVHILADSQTLLSMRAKADDHMATLIPSIFSGTFGDPTHLEKMKWPRTPVNEFAEVSYGIADKLDSATTQNEGTRILTISNVRLDGSINTDVQKYSVASTTEKEKAKLQTFDLLFNWRNGSEEHVGKTAIWEGQIAGEVLHVSFLLKIRVNKSRANPYFMWVYFNRLRATGFFTRNSRMQINTKFNASELSALELPLPPVALQDAFTADLIEVRRLEAEQAMSRERLNHFQQALLHRAFSEDL
jgi:type I restriction enzyme, S subunit